MLAVGTHAPDLELYSTPDQKIKLSALRGQKVILAFCPADRSPVCGDELSLFNATRELFARHHAQLLGISVDSKWSHLAFSQSRKLHFLLLADFEPKGAVARAYGYDAGQGEAQRALFVLDEHGIVRWNYLSPAGFNPGADGILAALEKLDTPTTSESMSPHLTPAASVQDHVQGAEKAPLTLVEYGDYQCSYCSEACPLVKAAQQAMGTKLRFVFRNFPLTDAHPHAQAAEAAGRRNKFWEMHDALYEHRGQLAASHLAGYAQALELNVEQFNRAWQQAAVAAGVEADLESGARSGVNGTPSFFVNGHKHDGDWQGPGRPHHLHSQLK